MRLHVLRVGCVCVLGQRVHHEESTEGRQRGKDIRQGRQGTGSRASLVYIYAREREDWPHGSRWDLGKREGVVTESQAMGDRGQRRKASGAGASRPKEDVLRLRTDGTER